MLKRYILIVFFVGMCFSCATKKEILYLQDVDSRVNDEINYTNAKIQPNDVLRIDVSALIPESAKPYNKANNGNSGGNSIQLMQLQGYLVSEDLTINFPVLGRLSVGNKTTQEFALYLRNLLEEGGHLKEPSVDVRLINAKVTVLGEVNQPGTYNFTEQNITLLQALGYAGDLTINGKREDVIIMRDMQGVRKVTHINLTTSDWLNGPYNFIKPNDIIVVNPNSPKVKSAGFIGNVGTLLSVVSILFSTIILITR
ncbi:polysaccharide biosynthesis/export family protein [Winogradskyella sp. SYSU M77433]|uniref:polysaccharide biosynthesis/export family protein n=1 Tax=Winogradskyella sp. SYSU M77433 TaxID=3042722 RepID=UPI00248157F1|nr:polysaccharide biosynthesis/export family protein [Winogradskyella sp. SYSU M77433]MDH7911503.1 polysaccharide biosynthesis/export family protein [Winogradskyella sp. SYSU M77433]